MEAYDWLWGFLVEQWYGEKELTEQRQLGCMCHMKIKRKAHYFIEC